MEHFSFGIQRLMIEHARHVPLRPIPWRRVRPPPQSRTSLRMGLYISIRAILPAHPLDEEFATATPALYWCRRRDLGQSTTWAAVGATRHGSTSALSFRG